jgi:hypothetical protein
MQALIDFDGWRRWKDFSQLNKEKEKEKEIALAGKKKKKKKNRMDLESNAGRSSNRGALGEGVAVSYTPKAGGTVRFVEASTFLVQI